MLCNKRKIVLKLTIHQNSAVSKGSLIYKHLPWVLKIVVFLADIGQTTKATIKQHWVPKTLKTIMQYNHYKNLINHSENDDENEK